MSLLTEIKLALKLAVNKTIDGILDWLLKKLIITKEFQLKFIFHIINEIFILLLVEDMKKNTIFGGFYNIEQYSQWFWEIFTSYT